MYTVYTVHVHCMYVFTQTVSLFIVYYTESTYYMYMYMYGDLKTYNALYLQLHVYTVHVINVQCFPQDKY